MAITPKHFAFRLRKDQNNYYAFINGIVVLLPAPTDKQFATSLDIQGPANFNDEGIRWNRHPTYSGITTSYSESLKFVGDGLRIVQYVFYEFDIEADLQLEVYRLNYDNYLYEPFFIGDLDFTTFNPEQGAIQVSIKDGGLAAIIKAGETIPYEISLSDPEAVYIYMSGMKFRGTYNWLSLSSDDAPPPSGDILQRVFSPYAAVLASEGDFTVSIQSSAILMQMMETSLNGGLTGSGGSDPMPPIDNYLFKALQEMDIAFSIKQKFIFDNPGGIGPMRFKIDLATCLPDDITFVQRFNIYNGSIGSTLGGAPNPSVFDVDITTAQFTLQEHEQVYILWWADLYGGVGSPSMDGGLLTFEEGTIKAEAEFILQGSTTPGLRYYDAFKKISDSVTDNKYGFRSDFLSDPTKRVVDNYPYNTIVSCGDGLRNINGAKMVFSFADIYKDADSRWCMGLGAENDIVRVEPLPHFYDKDNEIAYFDKVTNFRVVPDLTQRGNVLKIGMADQTYSTLNGKDEVNGTYLFKMPFPRRASGEIDLVSPFRYDPTGIEVLRRDLKGKDTTDNIADSTVVIITMSDDGFLNDGTYGNPEIIPIDAEIHYLYRPNNSTNTSGILFPDEWYNGDLTSKRSFLRNAMKIAMLTYKRDGYKILFQTFDKNQELQSDLGSGLIIEKADSELPLGVTPIYLPLLLQFTAIVPIDFNLRMLANPYGYIRTRVVYKNGLIQYYKGFVNKAGLVDAENSTFDFELQAHPDNDFSKVNYG